MKLSELVSEAKKMYPNTDPEIRVAGTGGFLHIGKILPRSAYPDMNFFGHTFEKGEFVVLEMKENV